MKKKNIFTHMFEIQLLELTQTYIFTFIDVDYPRPHAKKKKKKKKVFDWLSAIVDLQLFEIEKKNNITIDNHQIDHSRRLLKMMRNNQSDFGLFIRIYLVISICVLVLPSSRVEWPVIEMDRTKEESERGVHLVR